MGIPLSDIKAAMAAGKAQDRMAGDEDIIAKISELVDDIQMDEDTSNRIENLVQDARVYLPQRRKELVQLAPGNVLPELYDSGQAIKAAIEGEAYLNKLGRLEGDVPMPIMRDKGDTRVHTRYRTDGITGQELVVPVMDPSDRRVVLTTRYGPSARSGGHEAEPAMMNALKLMGLTHSGMTLELMAPMAKLTWQLLQ